MTLRRALTPLIAAAGLACAPAAALAADTTSSNWSGYVASRTGVHFTHVTGSWVQPAATCVGGSRTYSAAWVGLGGSASSSQALEQIGTEVDCSANGTPRYSAWYELVPEVSRSIKLTIHPGDRLTAAVTVARGRVTLRLVDHTTGAAFTKVRTAAAIDDTSAEWIVEAPSLCTANGNCEATPLADFATTTFTAAAATTTTGHTGTIGDAAWDATSIDLSAARGGPRMRGSRGVAAVTGGAATAGALSASGRSFTVTYQDTAT